MSPSRLAVGFIPRALPPVDAAQITPAPVLPLGTTPNTGLFIALLVMADAHPPHCVLFGYFVLFGLPYQHSALDPEIR